MTDVLTAIDDALDTGVAADEDPLTRELQELALMLRADSPEPTPEFRERMNKRVEAGFRLPKAVRRAPKRAWWRPLTRPAAAAAMTAAAVLVIAVAAGGLSGSSDDEDAGGGGGAAVSSG